MIRHNGIAIDRKSRTITVDGRRWCFSGARSQGGGPNGFRRFKLVEYLILKGGVTSRVVFDHLYGDDPNGGPVFGRHVIVLMLNQLQHVFQYLGLRVSKERWSGEIRYALVRNVV